MSDDHSSLTPVDQIPLISNDWDTSEDFLSSETEESKQPDSYNEGAGSAFTSNIDFNSSRFSDKNSMSPKSKITSLNDVSGNVGFGSGNLSFPSSGDSEEGIPVLEDVLRNVAPHPHFRLLQKRLNKVFLNMEHLSFIYRRRLHRG